MSVLKRLGIFAAAVLLCEIMMIKLAWSADKEPAVEPMTNAITAIDLSKSGNQQHLHIRFQQSPGTISSSFATLKCLFQPTFVSLSLISRRDGEIIRVLKPCKCFL